jgi:hypothetical protein
LSLCDNQEGKDALIEADGNGLLPDPLFPPARGPRRLLRGPFSFGRERREWNVAAIGQQGVQPLKLLATPAGRESYEPKSARSAHFIGIYAAANQDHFCGEAEVDR